MLTRMLMAGMLAGCGEAALFTIHAAAAPLSEAIKTVGAVSLEGRGNAAATRAQKTLAASPAGAIPAILAAMNGTNDLALNWFRAAVETIAQRELASGGKLPVTALEKFLADTSNTGHSRRLAFELIDQADHPMAEKLIAAMMDDPGLELRRDAVGRGMARAAQFQAAGKTAEAKPLYQGLLVSARDVDQVDGIAKQLRAMGETVDLARAFGFVMRWKIAGPFDSAGGKGFAAVYPPEAKIDFNAEYDGKTGKVKWQDFTSTDEYGNVSMNLPYKPLKGVAAYAHSEFVSDKPQAAEIRVGSENALKVWLNGRLIFAHEEYHRNKAIDQYRMPARLERGRNVILVKVCQNEQTEDWAVDWDFQLRVCDSLGAPLRSTATGPSTGGKL